jgi:hypothetical protein
MALSEMKSRMTRLLGQAARYWPEAGRRRKLMTKGNVNPTKRSTRWASMTLASAFISVLFFVAGTAHAGVSAQIHSFKVGGTIFAQGVSDKTGDDILDKDKFSEKDLGAICLMQEKLEKGQFPVLVINDPCGNINNNEIQIITEAPPSKITVGQIDFDDNRAIVSQKKGVDDTVTMLATVFLACLGAIDVDVEASAIATIKLNKETGCFESMKFQNGSGDGDIDGLDVLLDGIKADAKKPSN